MVAHLTRLSIILVLITAGLPVQAAPTLEHVTYADALAAGWQNWSWAQVNLAANSPTYTGSHSIAVTFAAWTGLYLHNDDVDTLGITHLRFYIHGGSAGGQELNVFFNLDINGSPQNGPAIAVPSPPANAWAEVQIPLNNLNPTAAKVTGITWQDSSGGNQPTLYIDDISLHSPTDPNAPVLSAPSVSPRAVLPQGASLAEGVSSVVVQVYASDPQGAADIAEVRLDASALGAGVVSLLDNGRNNDGAAGDGLYGGVVAVASGTPPGEQRLLVSAEDQAAHQVALSTGVITVLAAPGGHIPAALPQRLGWGSNSWSETPGQDWQVNSGVAWDYVYQYITYGWEGWGGSFVQRFVSQAWDKGYIPVVTVYMVLGTPPDCGEGGTCYASKLQNAGMVQAYLASLQRAAQEAAGSQPVIFNIEPDFYGFMQQVSNSGTPPPGVQPDNPASYPVALNINGYANNLASFGRYIVDLIHTTAPNALVAPMASMWATNFDPLTATSDEAVQMADRTAAFIDGMGGAQSDLLVVEWSDRDAGRGIRPWWDDTDQLSPRPTRALLWENALSRAANKRLLLWQVPVGNMSLENVCQRYQDNRPAYLFTHPRELFETGVVGIVFGGGDGCSTQVTTDGGFVGAQGLIAYAVPAAPEGLSASSPSGNQVVLRWDSNTDPDLWRYRVSYRMEPSGSPYSLDTGRRNSLTLALPGPGTFRVSVQVLDAMGNTSAASNAVMVTITAGGGWIYLPVFRY